MTCDNKHVAYGGNCQIHWPNIMISNVLLSANFIFRISNDIGIIFYDGILSLEMYRFLWVSCGGFDEWCLSIDENILIEQKKFHWKRPNFIGKGEISLETIKFLLGKSKFLWKRQNFSNNGEMTLKHSKLSGKPRNITGKDGIFAKKKLEISSKKIFLPFLQNSINSTN